jgi:2,5-furandicarboxylate decarboxylase 1
MRTVKDFRDYIEILEKNNFIVRVKKKVSTKYEISAILKRAQKEIGMAVFFEKVDGYDVPVVGNIVGTPEMYQLAFSTSREKIPQKFSARLGERVEPRIVEDGAVKQVVVKEGEVDLLKQFPIVTHYELDGGPYITGGIAIARYPSGLQNSSFNRLQVVGKKECLIRMMPPQHLGRIQEESEKTGKPLEVAIVIGVDPYTMVSSATKLPYGDDHLQFAGALRGEPVELVKCETIDVMVPANAEIVIEGEVLPGMRTAEGPFADFMGFYVPVMENHVFHVKGVTHRKNPLYYTVLAPSMDQNNLVALPHEAVIFRAVKNAVPTVKGVRASPIFLNCFISINKRNKGEAKNAIMAAFGVDRWLKTCVVVDEDVDIFDSDDVLWAISTRAQLDNGVVVIPDALGFPRDPYRLHGTVKIGIDATLPLDIPKKEFERARIPGEEKIRLNEYLQPAK